MDINESDDNFFERFMSTTQQVEETKVETEKSTEVSTPTEKIETPVFGSDDYSIQQNFEEEKNYEIKRDYSNNIQTIQSDFEEVNTIETPIIEKNIEIDDYKSQLMFNGRLKIALTTFSIIMASLVFAIIWNFVSAVRLNSTFEEKELQINELQLSIKNLSDEYNLLGDDENIKKSATELGYVDANDSNTVTVKLDEMFVEKVAKEVPSNWFNDVCNFLSKIFS